MTEDDLRRRSPLLRGLAETRVVRVEDGPGAGGRLVEVRTPSGLALDVALDRGGDLLRLAWRGVELGWHSAACAPAPWPALEDDRGLGFLRGFDGFLVTCGLDHHGMPTETDAAPFAYPPRRVSVHPLHGRIMTSRAEVLGREIDWEAGHVALRTVARQASVFGEVLELDRRLTVALHEPRLSIEDTVTNRGFRPTRHGILYHVNLGHPLLGEAARLTGEAWPPARPARRGAAPRPGTTTWRSWRRGRRPRAAWGSPTPRWGCASPCASMRPRCRSRRCGARSSRASSRSGSSRRQTS